MTHSDKQKQLISEPAPKQAPQPASNPVEQSANQADARPTATQVQSSVQSPVQHFDPKRLDLKQLDAQDSKIQTPPITHDGESTQHNAVAHLSNKELTAKMPSMTDNHKQTRLAEKRPFQMAFLAPKYWGIWLVLGLFLPLIYLPLRYQFWIGRKLGILIYTLAKGRRQDTLTNLKLAFPEKLASDRELMAKQVFVNQGIGLFETLCAWFRPNVFTRTLSISGLQHLINAQKENKAVLLLGAHYTMLDLGGRLMTQFVPVDCVYRPQDNPLLDWFIYNGRRHIFDEQIEHKDMRKLVSRIKAGKIIWYSPDQDYGLKHGVMAPFFGVPAATITAPRRLAKLGDKTNPPAVMALHTYRQTPDNIPRGKRPHYHLTITPALQDYPSNDEVADATRVNELLEGLIRIDPTQWMWFHRRFKNDENGRTDYYQK